MLDLPYSDLEKSTEIGNYAVTMRNIDTTISKFTNKLVRVFLWVLALPFVILGTVVIWFGIKRFVTKMPKALLFVDGVLTLDDKDDYVFHLRNRKAFRGNNKLYAALKKEKWFTITNKFPILSDLFKILKISSNYCHAVDEKMASLETTSFTSKLFMHRPASDLREARTTAYEYTL